MKTDLLDGVAPDIRDAIERVDDYVKASEEVWRLRREARCNPTALEHAEQELERTKSELEKATNKLKEKTG